MGRGLGERVGRGEQWLTPGQRLWVGVTGWEEQQQKHLGKIKRGKKKGNLWEKIITLMEKGCWGIKSVGKAHESSCRQGVEGGREEEGVKT